MAWRICSVQTFHPPGSSDGVRVLQATRGPRSRRERGSFCWTLKCVSEDWLRPLQVNGRRWTCGREETMSDGEEGDQSHRRWCGDDEKIHARGREPRHETLVRFIDSLVPFLKKITGVCLCYMHVDSISSKEARRRVDSPRAPVPSPRQNLFPCMQLIPRMAHTPGSNGPRGPTLAIHRLVPSLPACDLLARRSLH